MQFQSCLFRLSGEVRDMIYKYLVCKKDIHIVAARKRLYAYHYNMVEVKNSQPLGHGILLDPVWQQGQGCLGLLQSCRRIYTEAIDLIYSTATFRFHDYTSFFAFSSKLQPHRFKAIRHLHIFGRQYTRLTTDGVPMIWEKPRDPKNFFANQSVSYDRLRATPSENFMLPSGPRGYDELSFFESLPKIILYMINLEYLRIELDLDWQYKTGVKEDPRKLAMKQAELQRGVRERILPILAQFGALGIKQYQVVFTPKALANMRWMEHPHVPGTT
ncbi:hypothetical protein NX059_003032 [Plenodomus lindquistii]|nr:hypothetical protein NX059_003032 [Plenodomus lindquistii]